MSVNSKVELVKNLRDNILFFNNNLYKIIEGNTRNIYAFEYFKHKVLYIDVSLEIGAALNFECISEHVSYINFKNELNRNKIKLRVMDILDDEYKIIYDHNVANLYLIQYDQGQNQKNKKVTIKYGFNESLFNTNIKKLKGIYDIKKFIYKMSAGMLDEDTEYYKKIKKKQIEFKNYFDANFSLDDIKKMCEIDVHYMKPTTYSDYVTAIVEM